MKVKEFLGYLRRGQYTSFGCYPLFFIADDGQALSFKSAKENIFQCARAIRDKHNNGWRIVAVEVNWENPALFCSHSGERIESAYAEDEAT